MTHEKNFNYAVQTTVLKFEDVILRRNFVNISAKNIMQVLLRKKENMGILKI